MEKISTFINTKYQDVRLFKILIVYTAILFLFNLTLLSYYSNQTIKVLKNEAINNKDLLNGETTPPQILIDLLPYAHVVFMTIFSILGLLMLSFIIYLILKFNNEHMTFTSCFKIVLFSNCVFLVQYIILGLINLIFNVSLLSIIPSNNKWVQLINPFFLLFLLITYILLKDKTKLSKPELLTLIVILIIYKIASSF